MLALFRIWLNGVSLSFDSDEFHKRFDGEWKRAEEERKKGIE